MADLNESLRNAAAKPSREAPLSAIETRLRGRRRVRQGVIGVCAITFVGGIGGGVALSIDSGPSIRTVPPAAAQTYGTTDPPVSVELPNGWVESLIGVRIDGEILTVGTAVQPTGGTHLPCVNEEVYNDDVFVVLRELTHVAALAEALPIDVAQRYTTVPFAEYPDRPTDFTGAASTMSTCPSNGTDVPWEVRRFEFTDQGRLFIADVGFGPTSAAERRAEAYAVLNSLVVSPLTAIPEPVAPTVPTNTVPESADTAAIALAFETWIGSKPPDFDGVDRVIEDWVSIKVTAQEAAQLVGNPQCYTGHVDAITRIDEDDADVIFSFFCNGQPAAPSGAQGRAVKIDGVWMVSRDTVCETYAIGQARCPPRE